MFAPVDISNQSTFNGGRLGGVQGFIFHHTGGRGTPQSVVQTLNQRHLGVQYVMDRDGTIYRTLPQGAQGAHIMNSPDGRFSNANTMGMEVIANNDKDVTPQQVDSAKTFAQGLVQQYPGISIYGHGEVNPGHKEADEGGTITNAVRAMPNLQIANAGMVNPAAPTTTPTVGSTLASTATPAAGGDNRQLVFNTLTKAGLTPQQALGAVWSMGGESGGTLSAGAYNPKDPGGSFGIGQWLGDRRAALTQFAANAGKPVTDPQTQANFIVAELQGPESKAFDALKQAQTPQQAAQIWTTQYERPAVDNSAARIAQGQAHTATLDASGNFVLGDAKPTVTPTAPATGGATPTTTTPTPADRPATRTPVTPAQDFGSSLGSMLANLGASQSGGGSGGGGVKTDTSADQPAIRSLALTEATPGPSPVPQAFQGGTGGIGSTLGQLGFQAPSTASDPESAMLMQNAPSITQGAPGMTQMLGSLGTSDAFNYLDPRRTLSPSLTMRSPRIG